MDRPAKGKHLPACDRLETQKPPRRRFKTGKNRSRYAYDPNRCWRYFSCWLIVCCAVSIWTKLSIIRCRLD